MSKIVKTNCPFLVLAILLAATALSPVVAPAQSARRLEKMADASFEKKDYFNAAKWYAAILYDSLLPVRNQAPVIYPFQSASTPLAPKARPSRRNRIRYQLAESYRLYNHYQDALPQYEQYIASQDTRFPLAPLWYATCLLANNEPEKAIKAFNGFLKTHRIDDAYSRQAKLGIASANFVIGNRNIKTRVVMSRLTATVSSDGSNFALGKTGPGHFLFTTSRHELISNEKQFPVRLYRGNFSNNQVARVQISGTDHLNMAASSLSANALTLYFTGWKEGTGDYAIYSSTRTSVDSPWAAPVLLGAPINIAGYHSKQPFITDDGKYLLFASDRPGGEGKYDIWIAEMAGRSPAAAIINPGKFVNTSEEEVAPFYHASDSTLYFSSNGRIGMGGMDVYKTRRLDGFNQWAGDAVNLGVPFNSVKDDLYYTRDGGSDTLYLSSDRASACCLEVFRAVHLPDTTAIKKDSMLLAAKEQLLQQQQRARADSLEKQLDKLAMDSIDAVTKMRKQVHFDYASAKIKRADYVVLDDIVKELEKDPVLNILIASFTDCKGTKEGNIRIARMRSESVRDYLRKKGIDAERINIDFFGRQHFVLACKEGPTYNEKEQEANRRSDLIVTTEAHPKWVPAGNELDLAVNKQPLPDKNKNERKGHFTDKENKEGLNSDEVVTRNRAESVTRGKQRTAKEVIAKTKKDTRATRKQGVESMVAKTGITVRRSSDSSSQKMPARLLQKMPISSLLDLTPKLKTPDVVEEMTKRIPRKPVFLYSTSDSVRIDLYDNGAFDYDSVSVIYDKKLVAYKQVLQTTKPVTFYVKLDYDQSKNELIFFAENLGLTPPNSALMVITDGENKRTEVNVTSDLEHNTVVYFIKVKK